MTPALASRRSEPPAGPARAGRRARRRACVAPLMPTQTACASSAGGTDASASTSCARGPPSVSALRPSKALAAPAAHAAHSTLAGVSLGTAPTQTPRSQLLLTRTSLCKHTHAIFCSINWRCLVLTEPSSAGDQVRLAGALPG